MFLALKTATYDRFSLRNFWQSFNFTKFILASLVAIYIAFIGMAIAILPIWMILVLIMPVFLPLFVNKSFEGHVPREYWVLGILAFVAASLLWPKLLAIQVGGPDIRPQRLVLVGLLALGLYAALSYRTRSALSAVIKSERAWVAIFACVFLHRFLASVFSDYPFEALYRYVNELLTAGLMGALIFVVARWPGFVDRYFKLMLLVALVVVALSLIEALLSRNLFANIILPGMRVDSETREIILADKLRGGRYRVQSTFTNPLQLTEFTLFSIPLILPFLFVKSKLWKASGLVCIIGLLGALTLSGSRAGVGLAVIIVLLMLFAVQLALLSRTKIGWTVWIAATVLFIGAAIAFYLAYQAGYIGALIGGNSLEERQSSEARLMMVKMAWPKIIDHPIFGHGVGLAAAILGFKGKSGLTIDSYWLSYALESGLIGLVFLTALIVFSIVLGLVQAKKTSGWHALCIYALVIAVVATLGIKTILSLSDLDFMLFVHLSLLATARFWALEGRGLKP